MTPQELKNSILQLAIQGKLVEQRPEEGTADELYQQIQSEKQALLKAGKIKKEKPLPPVSDDEKPFDIPENWRWVRLGCISTVITKGTTPRGGNVAYLDQGIGFLRAENVAGLDCLDKTDLKFIDEKTHTSYLSRSILKENDILITIAGTLGRTALVREEDLPLNANQAVSMVRLVNVNVINLKYLIYSLNATSTQKALTTQKKVTAIPNLTLEIISMCAFPLPPLAEQKRIVAKIEELLPLIDRYEAAWTKLEAFNKRFPNDMQKSLLQMAIQGKLVEQRPEEGTAEDLYRQIQKEKQSLLKAGKIKKEKPLPPISDDEKPFEIPENWRWVRLGDCSTYSFPKEKITPANISEDMWSLDLEDIEKETGKIINFFCAKDRKIIGEKVVFHKGQILYSKLRPYLKKILIAPKSGICTPELVPFSMIGAFDCMYITYVLRAPHVDFAINSVTYGVKMPRVGTETMVNLLIPLPPLAEQKRIVAKLEELLPLCERLK